MHQCPFCGEKGPCDGPAARRTLLFVPVAVLASCGGPQVSSTPLGSGRVSADAGVDPVETKTEPSSESDGGLDAGADGGADAAPEAGRRAIAIYGLSTLEIRSTVPFAKGRDTLDESAEQVVQAVAKVLQDRSRLTLRLVGHADAQERAYPDLSLKRAKAVRDALLRLGIAIERLEVEGVGFTRPIDKPGSSVNRRVEFVVRDGG